MENETQCLRVRVEDLALIHHIWQLLVERGRPALSETAEPQEFSNYGYSGYMAHNKIMTYDQ